MKTILTLLFAIASTVLIAQTTWYEVATGVNNKLNVIEFASSNVGYIGGNDTLLLKSTNGGKTWQEINMVGLTVYPGGEDVLDLKFFSEDIGFMIVGAYGATYKTIDGGLNWTAIASSSNMCYHESFFFFAEDDGFIGGSGCFQGEVIHIYDGTNFTGATMNESGLGGASGIVDIDFLNADFGLAASSGGRIYRTTDGGNNWDSIPSGLGPNVPITSVEIINDTLAYAGYDQLGNSMGLLRTIDAGLTWAYDNNSATFAYPSFFDIIETELNHIYSGGQASFDSTGIILEHKGAFWGIYSVDQVIFSMTSYADSVVWGVGDSGYVVVNTPPASLSFAEIENEFDFSIFPNPTSEVLNIKLADNGQQVLQANIYELSGRLIKKENNNPTQINVTDLAAGIYLLEVQTHNGSETVRFVKD